ncbi:MAG TPA: hypothetical protein VF838_18570 [Trebonia sp.]
MAADTRDQGIVVDLLPPGQARKLDDYDAVIVGGALYATRWHRQAWAKSIGARLQHAGEPAA